jgi:parallel beta-helix repeat protein
MICLIINPGWKPSLLALIGVLAALPAAASVLTTDTVWKGEVSVTEDVLVPQGVTLTILPGTTVTISPSDSTKTEPEYLSPLTEITVRGTLKAEGTREAPVLFQSVKGARNEGWSGILIDDGTVSLHSCSIQGAETGVHVLKGVLSAKHSVIRRNRYGIVVQASATDVRFESSRVADNEYGIVLPGGARITERDNLFRGNKKKDRYSPSAVDTAPAPALYTVREKETGRIYSDAVLPGDTIWQGVIEVNGVVRVPGESRLLVMPGTIVLFGRKDSNGDGIGENGLLIQGILIAKGTQEQPIIFRSARPVPSQGDWDAINIMNSDGAQNLIEYCQIENAYRGLHFHFSNVAIHHSILRNNYRGLQFQESTVEIRGNHVYGNKSGIQARDSDIVLADNVLYHNYSGANFFRAKVAAGGNTFTGNLREGLRLREGIPDLEGNRFDGNRYGLMVSDSRYGRFSRNLIVRNAESGLLLRDADNVDVMENIIQGNGLNGINIQDSRGLIHGNDIIGNGERGIGVLSFSGEITGNNIALNGMYAVGIDGDSDVSAPLNWWGTADVDKAVYDKKDDPGRGVLHSHPLRKDPVPVSWPTGTVAGEITWHGHVRVPGTITVQPGSTLTLVPPLTVSLAPASDMTIKGRITAVGNKPGSIAFTSLEKGSQSAWGEVFLEHAEGSVFSYCDFEHATWAIHSHFTALQVDNCRFRNNQGGIRFRGGPLKVHRSLFEGNGIGIRAYRGSASITENNFIGNEVGIFVREKGGGLAIERNNLSGNSDYNIRIGDFNDEDVSAPDNYWGPGEPGQTILDGRKEPGIGVVHFEPYRRTPLSGAH